MDHQSLQPALTAFWNRWMGDQPVSLWSCALLTDALEVVPLKNGGSLWSWGCSLLVHCQTRWQMPGPSDPMGPEGAPVPPSPDQAEVPSSRSSRTCPEKCERSGLPAGVQIVYRVGSTILRRGRDDLEDTLLQFHSNPVIQDQCRAVLDNAEQYLTVLHLPHKGDH
jgi:hypothetical protein